MRDHGQLGRKAFHVRFFLFDEAARNQQGKRGVDVAGGLEALVERLLDVFPQRPAVRAHDHAAAHRRVVGQFRFQDELVVPFGKIFGARGQLLIGQCGKPFYVRWKAKRLLDAARDVNQRRRQLGSGQFCGLPGVTQATVQRQGRSEPALLLFFLLV